MLSDFRLREIRRHLIQGDVIAYPTEAVFGLGCDPLNARAVYRLLDLKRREEEKGLILIASHIEQLLPYLLPLSNEQLQRMQETWPGPVTWIVPCLPEVPTWLRGAHQGLAVRVSAHPTVRQICDAFDGPLVSTSANISGRPAARSTLAVRRGFQGQLDYIVHDRLGGARRPSQIRDLLSGAEVRAA